MHYEFRCRSHFYRVPMHSLRRKTVFNLIKIQLANKYFQINYPVLSSKSSKKSRPNSPLLSLNRIFLFSLEIFSISCGLNLKSPSRFDLIRSGVLDLGSTEWPSDTPHATKPVSNHITYSKNTLMRNKYELTEDNLSSSFSILFSNLG